jgi:hypothetical protein
MERETEHPGREAPPPQDLPLAHEMELAAAAAVNALDLPRLAERFQQQDEYLRIERFFSPGWIAQTLAPRAQQLLPRSHRSYVPRYKRGGSIGTFELDQLAPEFGQLYRSPALLQCFDDLTGAQLTRCPDDDPHACALYYYSEPGDYVGFHYDTSWYRGARYTVLIGLVQQSEHCRLHAHLYKDDPQRETERLAVETGPGDLILFNGDKLWHGVSKLAADEQRIVLTLEYLTDPGMAAHKRWISKLKDAVAYFGLKGIKRG